MIYFFCGSYIKLYFCHILLRSFPFCLKKKIVLFDLFCVKGIQSLITSYLSLESFCFYNIFFLWLLSPNQTRTTVTNTMAFCSLCCVPHCCYIKCCRLAGWRTGFTVWELCDSQNQSCYLKGTGFATSWFSYGIVYINERLHLLASWTFFLTLFSMLSNGFTQVFVPFCM